RRRCEIARALASGPSVMLLDEPFAGIDPIAVGDIQELVRHLTERGIGVLITDHQVRETLSLIDRAYIIYDGQVLTQGKPEEIIANDDVRRVYLGDMFVTRRGQTVRASVAEIAGRAHGAFDKVGAKTRPAAGDDTPAAAGHPSAPAVERRNQAVRRRRARAQPATRSRRRPRSARTYRDRNV